MKSWQAPTNPVDPGLNKPAIGRLLFCERRSPMAHPQSSSPQKTRLRILRKNLAQILSLGILYTVWVIVTGIYIPCPIRLATGFKCPGCGISHAIIALIHGNASEAWRQNPFILCTGPFLLAYALYRARKYVKDNDTRFRPWEIAFLAILLLAALSFGTLRNLPMQ